MRLQPVRLDQVWQRERDLLSYTWQANESALKRINDVIIQNILATSSANNTAATNAASVQAAAVAAEGLSGARLVQP